MVLKQWLEHLQLQELQLFRSLLFLRTFWQMKCWLLVQSLHLEGAAIVVFSLRFHHRHFSFRKVVLPSFTEQTFFFQERTILLDLIALVVITDKSLSPLLTKVVSFSKAVASATSLPSRSALLHQTTFHYPKVSRPSLACVKVFDIILVLAFHTILGLQSVAAWFFCTGAILESDLPSSSH